MKIPDSRLISTSYVTKMIPHEFSITGQKIGKAAQMEAKQISTMANPVGVGLFQLKSSDCRTGVNEQASREMEHNITLGSSTGFSKQDLVGGKRTPIPTQRDTSRLCASFSGHFVEREA